MNYRTQEICFSATLFLVGALLMYHTSQGGYEDMAQDINVGPMFFPRLVLGGWLICTAAMTVLAVLRGAEDTCFLWGRVLGALAVLVFFVAALETLGFVLSGVVCFFGLGRIIGYRRPLRLLGIGTVYVFAVQLLFEKVLQCYLPACTLLGG